MEYDPDSPFVMALATKYDPERELEAVGIVEAHPEIARMEWPGPDDRGQPFVRGATLLHYAANDGKLALMDLLVRNAANVNADRANWFRSVLAWAVNNARIEAIEWLLQNGADPHSPDALHAAAWGGSSSGSDETKDYPAAIRLLVEAGADLNEKSPRYRSTPLAVALESGNTRAERAIRDLGGGL